MATRTPGGYAIVDFDSVAYTSGTAKTVAGMYNKMQNAVNTNKPILLTNLKVGTYNFRAVFVTFYSGWAYFVVPGGTMRTCTIQITAADSVTVTIANL